MRSRHIATASATLLGAGGLALLFASDDILPRMIAGYPAGGRWVGQLLGAAWLGVAALDWVTHSTVLGGIYGRPIVIANFWLYFVSAWSLAGALRQPGAASALWIAEAVAIVMAVAYGWLLFRGPLARDLPR